MTNTQIRKLADKHGVVCEDGLKPTRKRLVARLAECDAVVAELG